MNKRLLIINWKWKKSPDWDILHRFKEYKIEEDNINENRLIALKYGEVGYGGAGWPKTEFTKEVANIIHEYNNADIILLLHKDNEIYADAVREIIRERFKVREFGGQVGQIYYTDNNKLGLLGATDIKDDAYNKGIIKIANFNTVWDYYWNQLELKYQRNKIVNLWLPLAIDIQGLREVPNIIKREEYLKEIENDVEIYADELIEEWNCIKSILGLKNNFKKNEPIEEVLDNKYRLSEKEKEHIYSPIEINSGEINKETIISFIRESVEKRNDKSLPEWFVNVIDQIDKKLAIQTSKRKND